MSGSGEGSNFINTEDVDPSSVVEGFSVAHFPLGSITSRCSGKEPALHERAAEIEPNFPFMSSEVIAVMHATSDEGKPRPYPFSKESETRSVSRLILESDISAIRSILCS